jgi:hypothetical protein
MSAERFECRFVRGAWCWAALIFRRIRPLAEATVGEELRGHFTQTELQPIP